MAKSKGFVFSLDAFVAFTLALVAVYSLIFFSSVPSGYYATLLQAHTLAKDTLSSLSSTTCSFPECASDKNVSVLEYVVFRKTGSERDVLVRRFAGDYIPEQFGYRLEIFKGDSPEYSYDTKNNPLDAHNKQSNKLMVSSSTVVFQFASPDKTPIDPYSYNTCKGTVIGENICAIPSSTYILGNYEVKTVKLTVYI